MKRKYQEIGESLQKCSIKTCIEVEIYHRMGPLGMLYSVTFTKKNEDQTFSIYTFDIKAWRGHRDDHGRFALIRMAASVELVLLML